MIGVNKYHEDDYERIPTLVIDEHVEREQKARHQAMKQRRDGNDETRTRHQNALKALRQRKAISPHQSSSIVIDPNRTIDDADELILASLFLFC